MLRPSTVLAALLLLSACSDDASPTGGSGGAGTGASGGGGTGPGGNGGAATTSGTGGAGGQGGGPSTWQVPTCNTVQGTAAVTITSDEGATLLPTSGSLTGVVYTFGLVAMDVPNTLLAASGGTLLRSTDAGCTWADVGTVPDTLQLVHAPGAVAYGFYDNQDVVVRIDATDPVFVIEEDPPGIGLHGLGVDPLDVDHIRVLDDAGQLHDSTNGGFDWTALGTPAANGGLFYTAVFDPTDLDHVLVGLANTGVRHSEDGGETWQTSTGVGAVGNANAFSIAFSPADPQVVYVEGYDLGAAIGEEVRRIWRSTDGGASFTPVVAESAEVTLTNGVLLAPHPVDPGVLYFEFGTYFQSYGTDIYRYDQATGLVTKTHNAYDSVSAIAFHPEDPGIMYFGLTSEEIN